MEKPILFLLNLLLCFLQFNGSSLRPSKVYGTADGSEEWGYVEVRPKVHVFWWLYRSAQRVENSSTPWPTVLWLQGGPGASGVGIGNFQEVGPLDTNLKPRNSTWLQRADLLFVDNPAGTGYSFVENTSSLVKTDEEAASDLTILLKKLYNNNERLQKSPLYAVAESYGGKFAVTLGLSVVKAIKSGQLNLTFGGVALGDSWISPEDYVLSWGPLLKDLSRLDINGVEKSNNLAKVIQKQISEGKYKEATDTWSQLEDVISENSNSVDFYNFLLDAAMDPLSVTSAASTTAAGTAAVRMTMRGYSRYLTSKAISTDSLEDLMNGVIKQKLKIIPKNVSWGGQSDLVFGSLEGDFMKPRINEVDELLSMGVNVTIYSGQIDLICATKGTEAWVQKLKWKGLQKFNNVEREPIYCENEIVTRGFFKSYSNLHFYWILEAGHFVPVDQPCVALRMISEITQSPAKSSSAAF
ncbi:serine carboxypeptidase-like 51 isoform X2 [Phalaenopsis equestris]|uniref:serine carboxypeptidase-like 51 isoform X2 n=1 Tax=Phalaenopsis equestris TaxID=78828 RepID=UPI0009E29603|nr:serine carboxypeptidase-like 51 isoform X2 [Phalaenopsis equestris]